MTLSQLTQKRSHAWIVTKELARMSQWLVFALALYFVVFDKQIALQESNPGLQASLYTLANMTVRAWLGYRIAVALLGKLKDILGADHDHLDSGFKYVSTQQAIIFGCALLARAIVVGWCIGTSR